MRSCRRFTINRRMNLLVGPFSVRVVGGRHMYGAFRKRLASKARIRFLKYAFRYLPIISVRPKAGMGIRMSFGSVVLRSGRRSKALAKSMHFVLCGKSRCRLAISSS